MFNFLKGINNNLELLSVQKMYSLWGIYFIKSKSAGINQCEEGALGWMIPEDHLLDQMSNLGHVEPIN